MEQQNDKGYLYHYTTAEALISIVKTQEIWASNIFYMNDTAEFHCAVDLAGRLLKAEMDSASDGTYTQRTQVVCRLLDDVRPGMTTMPVFAWSLSEIGDDLSQWRAYCPNGGVAIGFRQDAMEDLAGMQLGECETGRAPVLAKCVYGEREQKDLIRSWIDKAVKAEPGGRTGKAMSPNEVDDFRAGLLQWFLADKPIKHKTFEGEKEWRLVKMLDLAWGQDERVGFRSLKGLIIPYWKVRLDPDNNKKIWENVKVTVGPSPHPYEQKVSVENLLRHYCTGPKLRCPGEVTNSTVPYRNW